VQTRRFPVAIPIDGIFPEASGAYAGLNHFCVATLWTAGVASCSKKFNEAGFRLGVRERSAKKLDCYVKSPTCSFIDV